MKKALLFLLFISVAYGFDFAKSWTQIKDKMVIKQKYDFSCGASSLATVLTYFFEDKTTEEDIIKFVLGKKRLYYKKLRDLEEEDFYLSMKDLIDYLRHNSYKAKAVAVNIEHLYHLKYPAIIYMVFRGQEHFSVFKGIDKRYVYLADPSLGNVAIPLNRFKTYFYTRKHKKLKGKMIILYKDSSTNVEFMKIKHITLDKDLKKIPIEDILNAKPHIVR
ncbi:MAG: hypothetical protein GXO22_02615 [Aquificae bacterium]|nr:hypothetical protein [Aquificota bacterium]